MRGHTSKAPSAAAAPRSGAFILARLRASSLAGPLLLACLALPHAAVAQPSETTRLPTITTIGAVHGMTSREAARAYPVHVKAVITYYDPYIDHPNRPVLMVTDATASIFIGLPGETTLPLKEGMLLDITGQTGPGDFAPSIGHARIRILGQSSIPATAPRQTMTHLLTGSEDAQWVEMEGVVKSVQEYGHDVTLILAVGDGEIAASSVIQPGYDYAHLIDAKIRVHAIAGTRFNRRMQVFGVRLLFPGVDALQVLQAAGADPFALPISPISAVMRYTPGVDFNHRIHIRGIVTLSWPGRMLCIQNGAEAICAATTQKTRLVPGEPADVIGFPKIINVSPTLDNATYRALPGRRPLSVVSIDANEAFSDKHDSQLVHMDGRLIAHDKASKDPTIVVSSGKFTFSVILPQTENARALLKLQEGSEVRLTGICSVQSEIELLDRDDGYPVARYFQILLRSADDVVILKKPSWWTAVHTLCVLALALGVTLCILCWNVFLRIRLKKQTALLTYQATHDGLTGIWNRKAILDLLHREFDVAARQHQRIGVVMLDADHFKRVNDTYGHLAGDEVLKEIARRIQKCLRSYDVTGRYGGEEFLIVLPGCTDEHVLSCAERVRAAIAGKPVRADGSELAVTVSLGTAILDPLLNSQRDALATADGALYRAKHSGRNRVVCGEMPALSGGGTAVRELAAGAPR